MHWNSFRVALGRTLQGRSRIAFGGRGCRVALGCALGSASGCASGCASGFALGFSLGVCCGRLLRLFSVGVDYQDGAFEKFAL